MKIPAFRRIIVEDYKSEQRDFISKLAVSINSFMDTMNIALNGNLTITDNFAAVQKKITVTVNSEGTPTSGGTVSTGLTTLCAGTRVIFAVNNTVPSNYPSSCPFISFTNGNGTIIMNHISGLKANNSYTLTIILEPSS
jgi:hypothetical protein